MTITVAFIETITVTNPEGVSSTVDLWSGTRSDDSHTVELSFAAGTAQATVQATVENWFTVNDPLPGPGPAPSTKRIVQVTGILDVLTGEIEVADKDGKPVLKIVRDGAGNAEFHVVDLSGATRKILTPQAGTTRLAVGVAETSVEFETVFPVTAKPMVTTQTTDPIGNIKTKLNKDVNGNWTGFEIAAQTAPAAASEIVWAATPKKGL